MSKVILVLNCSQRVSAGCSGCQESATNDGAQLRQGIVLADTKTIASSLRAFVPALGRDSHAQRLRLIRAPDSDPTTEQAASRHLVQALELEHNGS